MSELDQKILSFSEQSISHEKGDFATETENFFTKNGAEEMAIGERFTSGLNLFTFSHNFTSPPSVT